MPSTVLELLWNALLPLDHPSHDEAVLRVAHPGARLGAVLALFYPRDDEQYLVLTRRSASLRTHSGQIALPGGRIDPADFSPAEAALRETREELGIDTEHLRLQGSLKPVFTQASNFVLLPYVAWSEAEPTFVPNPFEVAEVIELPLAHLFDAASARDETWLLRGEHRRVGYFHFREHKIWGATGRVLRQIVDRAGGPPSPEGLVPAGEVVPDVWRAEAESRPSG